MKSIWLLKNSPIAIKKSLTVYWRTSLQDYYYFAIHRNLRYLFFALLTGLFTFSTLKSYTIYRSLPETPLSVMILYACETALNFGLCLYMLDEWISRLWKEWGDFENRTVGKVWFIWFAAFLLAFAVQYLIIKQIFELNAPKIRWLYYIYPKEKPSYLLDFICIFPFWFIGVFSLIQIAIHKQSALRNKKSDLNDLLGQRNWVFKQNLVQPKTSAVSAPDKNKLSIKSKFIIPTANKVEQFDVVKISHINVEDHYCRIFVKEQEDFEEFYIKIPLKEIVNQLPRDHFLQIHRSHIVNLAYVSSLIKDSRSYQLVLNQGAHTLPISPYRLPQVLSKLEKLSVV